MKLVKMSLAAAVLLGASAFAIDNIKMSGDAQLFYGTNNAGTTTSASGIEPITGINAGSGGDLFDKGNSAADTALRLGVTGDLTKGVSFGVTGYAVSTLGLENNLVSNTWTGAHGSTANGSSVGAEVNDASWIGEAWLATTLGKTTVKAGRMALDTPLAYSETWSIAPNTFEGAVVINQDIPDTTLVGAWVGKGNGVNTLGANGLGGFDNESFGIDGIIGTGADFHTFANDGAYAAAAINNSLKFLTAQAWYYNVVDVADAFWLQADWDCQLVKDVKVGVQYANMSAKGNIENTLNGLGANDDSSAYAVKLAYEGIKDLKVSASYSKADADGVLKIANVATNNLTIAQSKLYTEAYMNYGYAGAPDASTYGLYAEYNAGFAKLGAQFTDTSIGTTGAANQAAGGKNNVDMTEATLTATKSFGPLDATVAYYSTDADDQNDGKRYDSVLAMLKLNF